MIKSKFLNKVNYHMKSWTCLIIKSNLLNKINYHVKS